MDRLFWRASLAFSDGATYTTTRIPLAYVQENPQRRSLGWRDKDAHAILQHMLHATTVRVRYHPSLEAVASYIIRTGDQDVVLPLAEFAAAWKALTTMLWGLPVMTR